MLASTILSVVMVAAAATASATPKPAPKQADSVAAKEKKAEPKNDVAKADTADAAKSGIKPAPAPVARPPRSASIASRPAMRGEVFVAPSVASLGERWADAMTGDEIGNEADRKVWSPAFAFGARTPIAGSLAIEVDGSATRFSAPVPGGRTQGWVGHAAGRAAWERGRFGGELGALVRVADLQTPETKSNGAPQILPSAEVHMTSATGTQTFIAAWNNPLLPYGDEGWLRAGARHDFGRLSGELAVGIDPILAGEDTTGPVIEARIEARAGRGVHLGVAMHAADEPMAAFIVRRVF